MNNLKIKKFVVGPIETNVYLVYNEETKKAFLVDCSISVGEYVSFIKENNLDLEFVIITHGHFDHIDGLNDLLKELDVPFYITEKDKHMLKNPMNNGSLIMGGSVVVKKDPVFVLGGEKIKFEDKELEIIETPGHSQGGISVKLGDWLFSGDSLFYHTIGRTDFPYSDTEQLLKNIKEKLLILDDEVQVFPGHGRETTIGEEKTNNPFV
ncbi:MBL fold metallo-hydrolase [Patescibacteria group bacterium]|nr:MBL fold metallo-hydrolase [Patescibacteria group bacterium]